VISPRDYFKFLNLCHAQLLNLNQLQSLKGESNLLLEITAPLDDNDLTQQMAFH